MKLQTSTDAALASFRAPDPNCLFCAERIEKATPRIATEITPVGRIRVGDTVLFPKTKSLTAVLLFAFAGGCFAQTSNVEAHRTNTQIIDLILDFQEKRLGDIAAAMPEEKYSFAPSVGEFSGVRTFAEQLKHIAADNYLLGAGILGKSRLVMLVRTSVCELSSDKSRIIAYLKDSLTRMHRAAAAIDDARNPIPTPDIRPGRTEQPRLGVAIEGLPHSWDHNGQLVEYLRMNGIVPPGSRRDGKVFQQRLQLFGTDIEGRNCRRHLGLLQ